MDVLNLLRKGPDRARRHSPCRVDRYSVAALKQSLEDQLAQFNKALKKAKADVTEFTTLLDAGKADLTKAEKSLAALVTLQASVKGFLEESMELAGATHVLPSESGGAEGQTYLLFQVPSEVHWSVALMGRVTYDCHRGSHTARSGQVPHTPGGTEMASADFGTLWRYHGLWAWLETGTRGLVRFRSGRFGDTFRPGWMSNLGRTDLFADKLFKVLEGPGNLTSAYVEESRLRTALSPNA